MSRAVAITAAVCVVLSGVACAAETLSIGPTVDEHVSSAFPTTNYAGRPDLYAGINSTAIYRSYLKFDLSALPEGAEVKGASLTLWATKVLVVPTEISAFGAGDLWEKTTITWLNAPSLEGEAGDPVSLSASALYTWNVTPLAATEAQGDDVLTVVLAAAPTPQGSYVVLADSANVYFPKPQLKIEYEEGAPTDKTPPEIDLDVLKAELWPANHKMTLAAKVSATDETDGPVAADITVTSDEPINGKGDGNTDYDWEVIDPDNSASGLYEVWLRAERAGPGDGRTYTIVVGATDAAGNMADDVEGTVLVPHDQGKGKQKGR